MSEPIDNPNCSGCPQSKNGNHCVVVCQREFPFKVSRNDDYYGNIRFEIDDQDGYNFTGSFYTELTEALKFRNLLNDAYHSRTPEIQSLTSERDRYKKALVDVRNSCIGVVLESAYDIAKQALEVTQ